MMLRLLVGPAASGKTERCIERIRQAVRDRPMAPVWVALPDRVQVRYFRRRLAAAGGGLGLHVGTFGDLYSELLERAGQPLPVATQAIVHRLLRAAVADLHAEGRLEHYAPIADLPGFLAEMRDHIAELKRARLAPEAFLSALQAEDRPQQELGLVYAAYERRLSALGWTDAEGLGWRAIDALVARPEMLADWALVVVDGFDDFVGAQRDAIAALAAAVQTLVTLPGEGGAGSRKALRRFHRTREKLVETCDAWAARRGRPADLAVESIASPPRLPGAMGHLEARLFEPRPLPIADPDGRIERIEARGPAEEAREALRWLKARKLRDDIDLDAMAIVTPEPERYRPLLRAAADEMGIPLRFTEGEPLIEAPAMTALVELLELPWTGWRRRALVDSLRSPFFDFSARDADVGHGLPCGLRPSDADRLEAVARHGQVVEGLEQWEGALRRLEQSAEPADAEAADDLGQRLPRGAAAAELRGGLESLARRLVGPPDAASMTDRVAWLEALLADIGFHERVGLAATDEARAREAADSDRDESGDAPGQRPPAPGHVLREQAALTQLREVLGALLLGEALVGRPEGEPGPPEAAQRAFVAELRGMLEGMTLVEPPRWQESRVLVARVIEARGPRFRAVAMLALAEGLFPQAEREDPLLDEPLRRRLGLEARLDRAQEGLFYLVATRAEDRLLLTRPYLAPDGRAWEASPYWKAAGALLDSTPLKIRPDRQRPLDEAASREELLFESLRLGRIPGRMLGLAGSAREDLLLRWSRLQQAREVLAARHAHPPRGAWEGGLESLSAEMSERFGPAHTWSASRLETYAACPLRFLTANILDLQDAAPPGYGPDAAQLGTLLHHILESAYQAAEDPADPDQVVAALATAAELGFAEAPEKLGFRPTPLWELEQAELREKLEVAVRGLAELEPGWVPAAHELAFGLDGAPPLLIEVDGEPLRLRGYIDRLDRSADGRLRVVDYKTGSGHLAARDLESGSRLQLPLYGLAARDALGLGQPTEGLYWAILAGKPGGLRLSRFEAEVDGRAYRGPEGAAELATAHVSRVVKGLRGGSFPPTPPADGCPSYCPAVRWCWRYQAPRRFG